MQKEDLVSIKLKVICDDSVYNVIAEFKCDNKNYLLCENNNRYFYLIQNCNNVKLAPRMFQQELINLIKIINQNKGYISSDDSTKDEETIDVNIIKGNVLAYFKKYVTNPRFVKRVEERYNNIQIKGFEDLINKMSKERLKYAEGFCMQDEDTTTIYLNPNSKFKKHTLTHELLHAVSFCGFHKFGVGSENGRGINEAATDTYTYFLTQIPSVHNKLVANCYYNLRKHLNKEQQYQLDHSYFTSSPTLMIKLIAEAYHVTPAIVKKFVKQLDFCYYTLRPGFNIQNIKYTTMYTQTYKTLLSMILSKKLYEKESINFEIFDDASKQECLIENIWLDDEEKENISNCLNSFIAKYKQNNNTINQNTDTL